METSYGTFGIKKGDHRENYLYILVKLSDSELCLGVHKSSSQQYTNERKEYPQQECITGAQLCSSPQKYTTNTPHSTQTPEQYYTASHQYNSTTPPKPSHHTSPTSFHQYTPNTPPHYGLPTHDMYTPSTPKHYISPTPPRYASTSQHCLPEAQSSLSQGSKALSSESESLHAGAQGKSTDWSEQGLQPRPHRSPRTVLLKDQIALMKAVYDVNQNPSREVKDRLVKGTGLPMKVIKIWFQNRRQKSRKEKQEAETVTNS
nr:unnamed protein product [Callosobruchus chinensis]